MGESRKKQQHAPAILNQPVSAPICAICGRVLLRSRRARQRFPQPPPMKLSVTNTDPNAVFSCQRQEKTTRIRLIALPRAARQFPRLRHFRLLPENGVFSQKIALRTARPEGKKRGKWKKPHPILTPDSRRPSFKQPAALTSLRSPATPPRRSASRWAGSRRRRRARRSRVWRG